MSSPDKWRNIYLEVGSTAARQESDIVAEFEQSYLNANRPKGMALFSHTPIGQHSIYMTPESVRHCDALLTRLPWNESNPLPGGPWRWLAGDESLKGD
jgi:hypothetical protein